MNEWMRRWVMREAYLVKREACFKSETKITFENGWKLTSLAENTDTRIPETITATAGLVGAIASASIYKGMIGPTEAPKEDAEYSISIYEMVWDGKAMKFDLENPVLEWSSRK